MTFTRQQWKLFWNSYDWSEYIDSPYTTLDSYVCRQYLMNQAFPKLEYIEFNTLNEDKWGAVYGDEKDINWFLLQL